MVEPLRHRQTKGAATDMLYLTPPRHILTLRKVFCGRRMKLFRTAGAPHERRRGDRIYGAAVTRRLRAVGNPLQAYQHQLRPGRITLLNGQSDRSAASV